MRGIKRMALGDYTHSVQIYTWGELGMLASDVNVMRHGLRKMIKDMKNGAATLDDNSHRLQTKTKTSSMLQQSDDVQKRTELLATATNEMTAASRVVPGDASNAAEAAL